MKKVVKKAVIKVPVKTPSNRWKVVIAYADKKMTCVLEGAMNPANVLCRTGE